MISEKLKSPAGISREVSLLVIFFISIIWLLITFSNFQTVDQFDWDQTFAYQELQRKIVTQYHQFPLWNPYICGGEPWLAHPESDFLSFHFLFILFFGTFYGIITTYFFQVFVGLLGMYFLSRYFGLDKILSLLNSAFFLNGFNLLAFVSGFSSLNISLLPWVYLFFNKSKEIKRYILYVCLLFAYLIYAGAYYVIIMASIVILIDSFLYLFHRKKIKFILSLLGLFSFAFFLGILKILPMLELIRRYPRYIKLPTSPGFLNLYNMPNFIHLGLFPNIFGYSLSITVFFLFLLSVILLWKKYRMLVIMNTFFILLALGDGSPINLWRLWHFFLPAFKEYRIFYLPLITILSLSAGLIIKEAQTRLPNLFQFRVIINLVLFFLVLSNVFIYASKIFFEKATIKYNLNNSKNRFTQGTGNHRKMFESIYNNEGIVYGYDSIGNQIKTKVIPRQSRDYKGEYFLVHGFGKIEQAVFSPDRLKFRVSLNKDDILVINQNYFPGWRSAKGRIISYNGLIGASLNKEDKEVVIHYLPTSFIIGIITFIFSSSFLVLLLVKQRS